MVITETTPIVAIVEVRKRVEDLDSSSAVRLRSVLSRVAQARFITIEDGARLKRGRQLSSTGCVNEFARSKARNARIVILTAWQEEVLRTESRAAAATVVANDFSGARINAVRRSSDPSR